MMLAARSFVIETDVQKHMFNSSSRSSQRWNMATGLFVGERAQNGLDEGSDDELAPTTGGD
jgi:hypothetical protein